MVKNHPSYPEMVYEAFVDVDRHAKMGLVKIKKFIQDTYEVDMAKGTSKQALKRALEHAVKEGFLNLIGASYKMTATGRQHLRAAASSPEPAPKKAKKDTAKKAATKKSTTTTKTGAESRKSTRGRAKAEPPTTTNKKTKTAMKKTNGTTAAASGKSKTQAKTSTDTKSKSTSSSKKVAPSNKIVAVPAGDGSEGPASPPLSDERPSSDDEEPQTETEQEEDDEGDLPSPRKGGRQGQNVSVVKVEHRGGVDPEKVTPEKNKVNSGGSVVPDVGDEPGAPRKRSARAGE